MKATQNLLFIAAITMTGLAACNYTVGECWYRDQSGGTTSAGAGGGVILPPGSGGGFGDSPPPGATEAPICNIVDEGPCYNECDAEDEARNIECAKIADEAQRTACQYDSYEQLKSCREYCGQSSSRTCHEKWEACQNFGPWSCRRGNPGSESKCYQCRDQCNSGAPPSGACRKCGF